LATRTAIVVLAAIVLSTLMVTPKYRASASLYVRMEQAPVDPLSQDSVRSSRLGTVSPLAVMNSYVETLLSRTTAERVVQDLELDTLPPPNALRDRMKRAVTGAVSSILSLVTRTMAGGVQEAPEDRFRETVDDLRTLVSAEIDQDTELILITALHPDRQLAQSICQQMADILVMRATTMTRADAASAYEAVAAALPATASRLEETERALSEFKREEGIVTLTDEQQRQMEQLGNLEMQHLQAKAALEETEARLATVHQSLASHGEPVTLTEVLTESPEVRQIESDLYQREQQLAALLSTHTEEHPEVVRLKSQIDAAQQRLAREVERVAVAETRGLSPEYETLAQLLVSLEGDRMGMQARREAIVRLLADSRAQLARLPAKERRLQELTREQRAASKSHMQLVERADELRLASQMGGPPVAISVIDPPRLPKGVWDIASPPYLVVLILGPVLAVLIGLTGAFVVEYFDDTLGTPEEVADRLALPVLVSYAKGHDAFARLRDEVWVRGDGSFPKVLLVASARRGEGTTSVVAGLAEALADALPDETILTVDANLRSPRLHELFGASVSPGLSDILLGRSDLQSAVQGTDTGNIVLLAAGKDAQNACMLLTSDAMGSAVESMRARAAVVLMDAPPIEDSPEVQALARTSDKVLMAVRADQTDRTAAQNARDLLAGPDGDTILGVVLNDVRFD
jgi:tyrosine-protein kinase Etk/Wzc